MARTTIHGTGPLDDIRYGRSLRGAGALLALAAGLLIPRAGAAQDADALRKEGAKLMGEGKLAEACPKLEESQRLAPSAGTLIDVAACHEKQGKIATAWQEFVDAEGEARKAGNRKIQADARARSAKLELRIPRLTVKIAAAAEGLEIKIDGVTLDRSSFNQPSPIDPGEHKVVASAPGKKAWEGSVSVKAAERKTISVPALADDPGAAAAAPAPPAAAPPVKEAPRAPQPAAAPEAPPPEPEVTTHQAERLVIDVGAGPGFLLGVIGEGSLTNIQSYVYDFNTLSPDGEIRPQLQPCDDEVCWGIYDPAAGVLIGGQAFVGYAVKEDLHVGARVLGGYRFGGGYLLVGGPSGAMEVGDLWLGATLAFGGVAQAAPVTGVRGEIPEDSRQYNQDAVTKDVDTSGSTPLPETEIVSTWAFGATLEISYPIVDVPSGSWTSGALVVSAWPSFFKGLEGFAIAVPVTIGYRFY